MLVGLPGPVCFLILAHRLAGRGHPTTGDFKYDAAAFLYSRPWTDGRKRVQRGGLCSSHAQPPDVGSPRTSTLRISYVIWSRNAILDDGLHFVESSGAITLRAP